MDFTVPSWVFQGGHLDDEHGHASTLTISTAICDSARSRGEATSDYGRVCPGLHMTPCTTDGGEAGCKSTGICFKWAEVDSWPASWYVPRPDMPEPEPDTSKATEGH